jgi:LysM repeat protein
MPITYSLKQRILFLIFCIVFPALGTAQQQEFKDYTIEKGDTLWGISNKELKDPFLWPKIWKENPDIKNPDLIYPTQTIKIPLHLLQKESMPVVPETRTEIKPVPVIRPKTQTEIPVPRLPERRVQRSAEPEYLVNRDVLILSGYIADPVHSLGKIYDKPGEISNLTKGDYAYIQTKAPVKKGDKFYIIYPVEEVKHPVTGRYLGVRIAILGTAEVVDETDPKIHITRSYTEIPVGSLIDDYYEIEPTLAVKDPRKPQINGYIVSSLRRIYAHGNYDIVFIDKGRHDGLKVGDLLATTLQNKHKIYNGLIQVIKTGTTTSAAIVRKNSIEITIGDGITGAM